MEPVPDGPAKTIEGEIDHRSWLLKYAFTLRTAEFLDGPGWGPHCVRYLKA
jgi:hypothetical protein